MKRIAQIPSFLLSAKDMATLKLQDQAYFMIIPQKLLEKFDILSSELTFDLVVEDTRLSLLDPKVNSRENVEAFLRSKNG